jgi:NitT/TauT family transport system substrate-binding protein
VVSLINKRRLGGRDPMSSMTGPHRRQNQSEGGSPMRITQSRRQFLAALSWAWAGSVIGAPRAFAAEGPPETTTVRFVKIPGICNAPQYVAEELLQAEGFTEIGYVGPVAAGAPAIAAVARGHADFTVTFAAPLAIGIDGGARVTVVSGVHIGCFELFGNESIRSIADLRGKSVGVQALGSSQHVFTAAMAAYVGLDPAKDIHWAINPSVKPTELYEKGQVDAFLGFPPEPQDLRARDIGRVIVNSAADRPWSQYFCCMLAGNSDYVSRHPVATKRVLRAVLKADELCGSEPSQAARRMVDRGLTPRYDYALQALSEIPYPKWREYDAEDTLRFYALRLHEAGMVKSTPQKIIAGGTDWRFLDELKRELKA